MGITVDGNSLTITDATFTLNNAFDATTGTATITITPDGGLGTLPGILEGQPGPPPNLAIGTVTTLSAGSSATASLTQLTPGGNGTPSTYSLNLGIPIGSTGGDTFTSLIQGGIDALVNDATLVWDSVVSLFVPTVVTPPAAVTYYASSIDSTSGTTAGPRTLTQISIPSQSFPWVPQPSATCVVAGPSTRR